MGSSQAEREATVLAQIAQMEADRQHERAKRVLEREVNSLRQHSLHVVQLEPLHQPHRVAAAACAASSR